MDVMFTAHPQDGPGKYYMVVAESEEWRNLIEDLESAPNLYRATQKMIDDLKGWGI